MLTFWISVPLVLAGCSRSSDPELGASGGEVATEGEVGPKLDQLRAGCETLALTRDAVEQHRIEQEIGHLVEELGGLGEQAAEPLVRALESSGPSLFRQFALDALASASPRVAAEWAAEALPRAAEDALLRVRAARVLLDLDLQRGRAAVEAALQRENEQTFPPLAELVDLLADHAGADAIPSLLPFLEDRWRGTPTLYRAVEALGRLRAGEAVGELRRIVLGESVDHFVRRKAVQSLVEIEGKAACPFLERCAAEERETNFRSFLEDTLVRRCR